MATSSVSLFFNEAERKLTSALFGRTLLGEIVFSEKNCNEFAGKIQSLVEELGPGQAIRRLAERWPLTLSVWLVNEAFFNFQSGAYWPYVLGKIGIEDINKYSSRFGKAFLECLKKRELPEFRQLKTRWSYLGPILAHCGIPASCLPEFFEKVVPRSMDCGMADGSGFDDLLRIVPRLYLTKPTERFLLYGGKIAEDFLQRSIEMLLVWQSERRLPGAQEIRLPDRVLDAFSAWVRSTPGSSCSGADRRVIRRPEIYFDPYHGLRLFLPPQRVESDEHRFTWILQIDSSAPERVDTYAEPGERVTVPKDYFLLRPFSSLQSRLLVDGVEKGSWSQAGISGQYPFLFFNPDNSKLISTKALEATRVGIVHLPSWRILGRTADEICEPEIVEDFGPMPFGWSSLVARVYDLKGIEELSLQNQQESKTFSVDLEHGGALGPRLVESAGGKKEVSHDQFLLFWGKAPALEIWRAPRQSEEEFLASWTLEIQPTELKQSRGGVIRISLSDLRPLVVQQGRSLWRRLELGCEGLLGAKAWGEYQLRVKGPIGQDARFLFRVLPEISVSREQIDWSNIGRLVKCCIRVPPEARLRGAEPTDDPQSYLVSTSGDPVRVCLCIPGFRDQDWELPFYVNVPLPAWAVYQPKSGRQIVSWTREPLQLSVAELEGGDPLLLLKLATPRGNARSAKLTLEDPKGIMFERDLAVDSRGYGRVDLAPFVAETRQRRVSRLDLVLQLQFDRVVRLVCANIVNRWLPKGFSCQICGKVVRFHWTEKVPIENRAILVRSLLLPWQSPHCLNIPDQARGEWEAATDVVFPIPGVYRVTLGQSNEWSETFEPAEGSSITIEYGSSEEWKKNPLFLDSGPDGYLFRLTLSHYNACSADDERLLPVPLQDGAALAGKVLAAREAFQTCEGSSALVSRLDVLLGNLPSEDILSSIAKQSSDCRPETILRARLFTRKWRPGSKEETENSMPWELSDADSEKLWRIWGALGMWADMHGIRYSRQVEARILRHVGVENVRMFCPFQENSTMHFTSADKSVLVSAAIVRVESGEDQTPFDIMRLDQGVRVELKGKSPADFQDRLVLMEKDGCGRLRFESQDSTPLPDALGKLADLDPSEVTWRIFYPDEAGTFHGYPEPAIINLVRTNASRHLEAVRCSIPSLPRGAVGPQAFQDACFGWCIRAASDPAYRKELSDLCAANALDLSRELEQFRKRKQKEGRRIKIFERLIYADLRRRWFPNAVQEPLYGVHFLSLAVSVGLVWKGIGRAVPFSLSEKRLLEELAPTMIRLIPELLTHDIMMICLVEALFLSGSRRDASRSGAADQGSDGELQQLLA